MRDAGRRNNEPPYEIGYALAYVVLTLAIIAGLVVLIVLSYQRNLWLGVFYSAVTAVTLYGLWFVWWRMLLGVRPRRAAK